MEAEMMPVLRVSNQTWERLKLHAQPLEDTADDVVRRALDALEAAAISASPTPSPTPRTKIKRSTKDKTPQRAFRSPLLRTLIELGGTATVASVRKAIEPKVLDSLLAGDFATVSTGEAR